MEFFLHPAEFLFLPSILCPAIFLPGTQTTSLLSCSTFRTSLAPQFIFSSKNPVCPVYPNSRDGANLRIWILWFQVFDLVFIFNVVLWLSSSFLLDTHTVSFKFSFLKWKLWINLPWLLLLNVIEIRRVTRILKTRNVTPKKTVSESKEYPDSHTSLLVQACVCACIGSPKRASTCFQLLQLT